MKLTLHKSATPFEIDLGDGEVLSFEAYVGESKIGEVGKLLVEQQAKVDKYDGLTDSEITDEIAEEVIGACKAIIDAMLGDGSAETIITALGGKRVDAITQLSLVVSELGNLIAERTKPMREAAAAKYRNAKA